MTETAKLEELRERAARLDADGELEASELIQAYRELSSETLSLCELLELDADHLRGEMVAAYGVLDEVPSDALDAVDGAKVLALSRAMDDAEKRDLVETRLARLESEALRFYNADGTFEELESREAVANRRIAQAVFSNHAKSALADMRRGVRECAEKLEALLG